MPPTAPPAPRPRAEPRTIVQLGRARTDEYAWMKDANWREVLRDPARLDPEIRAHLEAENAYADALLAPTEALQARLFAEMKGRIKQDDASAPSPDGPFDYFHRFETGAQYPRHVRRARGSGPDSGDSETVLLDEAREAQGKPYYAVEAAEHSPDHRLFAWAVDEEGSEYCHIRLRDLVTGETLPGGPENASGDFAFSADSAWLFWIWRDENARPAKVFRRPARGGKDVLIYGETDPGLFLGVGLTADRSHLLIVSRNQDQSETRIIASEAATAAPRLVEARCAGLRYDLDRWSDRWVIRTNADGAVDFRLAVSTARLPSRDTWREWIAHRPGRLIAGLALYADHFVRLEREDALDRLVVGARNGGERVIEFPESTYALSLSPGYEYDTGVTRFVYQSPTTPRQWFDYDMASGERRLIKTQEIPSGHDPAAYETRRLEAAAPDGARVPITVLMRRGAALDGSAPLMLYGYGAYGFAQSAAFSTQALSLVDRGWIWAWTHVRGGSDKGWGWFLDGRGAAKPNTFSDFIASAEALAALGYGRAGRMVAYGGSAGGMLVGAVVNLRPDLWGAAIAAVPFVDVLNTMSDADLPLTPPEWPEWGDPIHDAAAYDVIAGYSPYDNVAPRPYPAILARAGLTDPRVTWWEPEKWIARLRAATTGTAPLLLKVNLDAGHGGASGRFDHLKEVALDYAFALWALGEAEATPERGLPSPSGEASWRCEPSEDKGPMILRPMIVRPVAPGDMAAVAAIYGAHVLAGTGTFEEVPPGEADIAGRIARVTALGLPYLVAEEADGLAGFAYAAPFRPRAAYRFTVEDSVYVAPAAAGRGVGKALLAAVVAACEAKGLRQMIAVIGDARNLASIGLHRSLGFQDAGTCRSVGFKHGRWLDTVWMQRALNEGDTAVPSHPGLALSGS